MADSRGRFAEPEEIVGHWKMVPLSPELAAQNKVNPWPLPVQFFAFYADGRAFSYMSSAESEQSPDSLDKLNAMLPQTVRCAFRGGFLIISREDSPGSEEKWGVNVITQDFASGGTDFQEGDLVMSLDSGDGEVVYRRLLRRIE